jgi:SAM-dependent methyltransferase
MTVKEHYDQHLGNFYSWMVGDFALVSKEEEEFFMNYGILPLLNKKAVDFGAGHGVHSVALVKLGFKVTAVDFNKQLLKELIINKNDMEVEAVESDIYDYSKNTNDVELCLCMGDTLAHFDSIELVQKFFKNVYDALFPKGKFVISFRDYSVALRENSRFIPVKSDDTRILTCFLEYFDTHVNVYDILYEKVDSCWIQKISSYKKIRLTKQVIKEIYEKSGFRLVDEIVKKGMIYFLLEK